MPQSPSEEPAILIRNVNPDERRRFKTWCQQRDWSMNEVLIHLMNECVEKNRVLDIKRATRKK